MSTHKTDPPKFGQRTEEVQQIIERMPTNFGFLVTCIVILIFSLLMIFGWTVRYPDVVRGQVIINSSISPIKLISSASGKLKLNSIKSMDDVKEGQVIGYIENPTNPLNVLLIDSLLKRYDPTSHNIGRLKAELPTTFSLGELNAKYYNFINSLENFINYKDDGLLTKQQDGYLKILREQENSIASAKDRLEMGLNSLKYAHKFYSRDSLLFIRKVISEAELDKSQMAYITNKDNYQSYQNNLINARQQIQTTKSKIQELSVQNPEKDKEVRNSVISSYNDLIDNIKIWEQKYVFRSPFNGKVQFLKFWSNNQFLQAGEQVFTIVPKNDLAIGQVTLPVNGAGKVKVGMEVIIKLDDYPYNEYGSVKGIVKSISLTTNTVRTEKGDIDNYLIQVDFPNQLRTNYGTSLSFKYESKGSAEIITNDRKLIERLFDNLKYITK